MPKMILAPPAPAPPSPAPPSPPQKPGSSAAEQQLPPPTNATPGTPEKIAILKMRMERGFALHHPEDRNYDPPLPEGEPIGALRPLPSLPLRLEMTAASIRG